MKLSSMHPWKGFFLLVLVLCSHVPAVSQTDEQTKQPNLPVEPLPVEVLLKALSDARLDSETLLLSFPDTSSKKGSSLNLLWDEIDFDKVLRALQAVEDSGESYLLSSQSSYSGAYGAEVFHDKSYTDLLLDEENAFHHLMAAEGFIGASGKIDFESRWGISLIYLDPDLGFRMFPVLPLRFAVERHLHSKPRTTAEQRLEFFYQSQMPYNGYEISEAKTGLVMSHDRAGCTYSPGRVTPCKRDAAVFWGYDGSGVFNPGTDGYVKLQEALDDFGYDTTTIMAKDVWNEHDGNESLFSSMREAEVLILNAHGGQGGTLGLQCYGDVALRQADNFVTQECCERLRASALAFGLDDAATMNCAQADRPTQDPTGTLAMSLGNASCRVRGIDRANRCKITARNSLINHLSPKAVIASAACFSGQCPNMMNTAIADYFVQSPNLNYGVVEICDDEQLGLDITGESLYCKENISGGVEPWSGQAINSECLDSEILSSLPDGLTSSIGSLRTLQGSVNTRKRNAQLAYDCAPAPVPNPEGWIRYQVADMGGNPNVSVEFAPTIENTLLSPNGRQLVLVPTSRLNLDSAVTDFETTVLGVLPKYENEENSFTDEPEFAPGGDRITLGIKAEAGVLPLQEWRELEPQDLLLKYGQDQTSWSHYLEVSLKSKTPAGIPLVGNKRSINVQPWIEGSKADNVLIRPYQYNLGNLKEGGDLFKVQVPLKPQGACCVPLIEWEEEEGVQYAFQNGCFCTSDLTPMECAQGVGTCVSADGQMSEGSPDEISAACEAQDGVFSQFSGQYRPNHDCCSDSPECESTRVENFEAPEGCDDFEEPVEYLSGLEYVQTIARPWDTNGWVAECLPASIYSTCGGDDNKKGPAPKCNPEVELCRPTHPGDAEKKVLPDDGSVSTDPGPTGGGNDCCGCPGQPLPPCFPDGQYAIPVCDWC